MGMKKKKKKQLTKQEIRDIYCEPIRSMKHDAKIIKMARKLAKVVNGK